ncbi:hypothetical protein GCM10027169_18430 [Gordonia jinhuaensis]|uniref:HTH cro/C1-type domain-containing protein n=1 Tax=Gordonia jinhuaensis TaxID=1517702 RepID=A0A916TIV1_9ACTN|nr:helix-turn-helix transcriptional regulator [Gordonia jinhuaensis]GGB46633.1 hypothetical protein GCM10011489_37400 [Gordonia jinhuaensis]
MPRPKRPAPRDYSQAWPTARCESDVAEAVRLFAVALRRELGDRSTRQATERTGVTHTVIADILAGTSWPDAETIGKLETSLGVALWPTLSDGRYPGSP